ncbi:MAG: hypothetical protein HYZ53_27055 [Planctomycetes bacterium]|nr:hypothetical protein [Planctomycetota bacterium]
MLKNASWLPGLSVASAVLACAGALRAGGGEGNEALLKALPSAKVSLADGIQQAGAKAPEAVTSAKFEMDHEGKLSLSVYTSEKGFEVAAEENVLKELSGSPTGDKWTPEAEVFKDAEHLKRAATQHTVMSIAAVSLLDIVTKAAKEHPGTVFSAIPEVSKRKAVVVVLVAKDGKVTECAYDLGGNAAK